MKKGIVLQENPHFLFSKIFLCLHGQADVPARFFFAFENFFDDCLAFSLCSPWKKAEEKIIFAIISEIVPKRYVRIVVVIGERNFRKSAKSRFCFCFNK